MRPSKKNSDVLTSSSTMPASSLPHRLMIPGRQVAGHPRYLSAAFHGISAAVPQMKQQRWGRVVNIASAHGLVASTHKAAYVAAKHGLVGLTKVVGLETAGSGVTCNAVCPGWVRTPLVEKQISDIATQRGISQKQATEELLAEKQPSLDFASPEQLGGTVAFLCSAAADQITGTAISVDGGWTAR
ncbi:NAD(P)-dependent dehydrogenase (short-subunit alcohol dehydrogenase family) [Bradyrhizobium sp. USDA 4501]